VDHSQLIPAAVDQNAALVSNGPYRFPFGVRAHVLSSNAVYAQILCVGNGGRGRTSVEISRDVLDRKVAHLGRADISLDGNTDGGTGRCVRGVIPEIAPRPPVPAAGRLPGSRTGLRVLLGPSHGLIPQVVLLDVGHDENQPAPFGSPADSRGAVILRGTDRINRLVQRRREAFKSIMVIVQCQANLLAIIQAV